MIALEAMHVARVLRMQKYWHSQAFSSAEDWRKPEIIEVDATDMGTQRNSPEAEQTNGTV